MANNEVRISIDVTELDAVRAKVREYQERLIGSDDLHALEKAVRAYDEAKNRNPISRGFAWAEVTKCLQAIDKARAAGLARNCAPPSKT